MPADIDELAAYLRAARAALAVVAVLQVAAVASCAGWPPRHGPVGGA